MITVIVPIHNTKKYIDECLSSILNQSYKNIEIILIDSSTDNTKQKIAKYLKKDKRIIYIYNKNSSYGFKINYGIKKSRGNYISVIDSDDYIDNDFYKSAMYYMNKYKTDFVKFDFYMFHHNKINGKIEKYTYNLGNKALYKSTCNSQKNPEILYMNCTSYWSGLYSKTFLLENKIKMLESQGASFQDTSFYILTHLLAKSIKYVKKAFYHYRIDNKESSIHNPSNMYAIIEEHRYIDKVIRNNPKITVKQKEAIKYKKIMNYYWNYNRLDKASQIQFIHRISKETQNIHLNNKAPRMVRNKLSEIICNN